MQFSNSCNPNDINIGGYTKIKNGYPLDDAHMAIILLKPKWEEFATESAGCDH